MSAEFYIQLEDKEWRSTIANRITKLIEALPTFCRRANDAEFWLKDSNEAQDSAWAFDVRLFLREQSILLEISSHPAVIERDLKQLVEQIRNIAPIKIVDEDGEPIDL